MIATVVVNTISWFSTIQQPVNGFIAKYIPKAANDVNWLAIIAAIVFLGVVIWTIWDLCRKIEESENKKPSICVIPKPTDDLWYLDVTNNGERGIFTAQVCVFVEEESGSKYVPVGSRYSALWGSTNTDKSEIMNGQRDTIMIATIRYTKTAQYFVMKAYDTANKSPYDVRCVEYEGFRDLLYQPIVQVIISSDPSLKGGAFIREYSISLEGIIESKPKKRISIPDKYTFGEQDESEARYLEAETIVEELKSLSIFDDSSPGDLIRVFYYLRDKLAVGMCECEASVQDKLVLTQLNLHKIVRLEQRQKASGLRMYDEGFWVLTELGKEVILYLQTNKQVLDKEGSQS